MLKHVGKMKHNAAKVCVVYRTLPGDAYSALVVGTAGLAEVYHNSLMKELESVQGQDAYEFGELLNMRHFPDGQNMLVYLHTTGKLVKVATDSVIMTPTTSTEIPLDQLNLIIAEQRNCAIDDLSIKPDNPTPPVKAQEVQVDDLSKQDLDHTNVEIKDLSKTSEKTEFAITNPDAVKKELLTARDYRSEADRLYKEAAKLRKLADDLDPPKKKSSAATITQEAS